MKKIFIVIGLLGIFMLSGCAANVRNSVGVNEKDAQLTFKDTGIDVRNHQDRVYHIVKDKNGFLYYCSDIEGNLELVLDKDGKPTKDINIFE